MQDDELRLLQKRTDRLFQDILEQANDAATVGDDNVKRELLSSTDSLIIELQRLTKDDKVHDFSHKRIRSDVADWMDQQSCDKEGALISTICLYLFVLTQDCTRRQYYYRVLPRWIHQWYKTANAWDFSQAGTLPADTPEGQAY